MSWWAEVPGRALRVGLLALSRRRRLGDLATRAPLTRAMVDRFVAGESLADAVRALQRLRVSGLHSTVDLLGESVMTAEAAAASADRYLDTLDALAAGGLDGNVSLKLSQMGLAIDRDACRANVERIFARAARTGSFVRLDMEDHATTDATLELWRTLRSVNPASGVVIQAALRRSAADIERLIAEGGRVRLCKGAYDEPSSVAFVTRAEVDASYRALMDRLLHEGTYPALATHDPRLIELARQIAERDGIAPDRFEFQMLYGVRRDLQEQLVRAGYQVRIYVPFGREWYPYFMRRLAERPANVAFLLRSVWHERGRRP